MSNGVIIPHYDLEIRDVGFSKCRNIKSVSSEQCLVALTSAPNFMENLGRCLVLECKQTVVKGEEVRYR
jgi:hypothetical protein